MQMNFWSGGIFKIGLCLLIVLLVASCTARFYADFEDDTIGDPPSALPPGMPSDQIIVSPSNTSDFGPNTVTVEEVIAGRDGSQALQLSGGGDTHQTVFFVSDHFKSSNKRILVQWQQAFIGSGGVDIYIQEVNPSTENSCLVQTVLTGLVLSCSGTGDRINVTGFSTFEPHLVTLTLNRNGNSTLIAVTQEGVGANQDRPAIGATTQIPAGNRLRTQITFRGGANSRLLIDKFTVNEMN